jgi:integrase
MRKFSSVYDHISPAYGSKIMAIRTRKVKGQTKVFIDFWYNSPLGARRYRKDFDGGKKAAQAEERRLRALLEQNGGVFPDQEPSVSLLPESPAASKLPESEITFGKAVDHYRRTEYLRKKPNTQDGYDEILASKHLSGWLDLPLSRIDSVAFGMLDAGISRLSPSRRRNIHTVIRAVVRAAKEGGLIDSLPPLPRLPRVGQTAVRLFPKEHLPAVLQALPSTSLRVAVALAAWAGLRIGEIRGLRWSDVDLRDTTEARLVVQRGLSTRKGRVAPPKSSHQRTIPLPAPLVLILKEAKRDARGEAVVANNAGLPVTYGRVSRALKQALKTCGIKENLGMHSLRHLFVTTLFKRGVGATIVQRLAGHSSLEVTQRYSHIGLEEMKGAMSRFTLDEGPV